MAHASNTSTVVCHPLFLQYKAVPCITIHLNVPVTSTALIFY